MTKRLRMTWCYFLKSNGNLEWAKEVLHHFSLTLRAKVNELT
jgi:hypothetical protein